MKNIRTMDIIVVTDPSGVLGKRHKTGYSGNWKVISSHEDMIVAIRGARIMRVRPNAVDVVGHSNPNSDCKSEDSDTDLTGDI